MASAAIAALMSTYITAGAAKTITYNGSYGNGGTTSSTQTFTSVSFGAGGAGQYVVIGVSATSNGSNAGRAVSSATIGGVSATIIESINSGSSGGSSASILIANVSATSGTVVLTMSGNCSYVTIGSWAITGISGTAAAFHGNADGSSNPGVFSLGTLAGGVAVGVANAPSDSGGAGFSWSGLTEDYDTDGGASLTDAGGAHASNTNGSNISVSVTWTTSDTRRRMACASW